jgi:AAA15 family ATPase/GTPase
MSHIMKFSIKELAGRKKEYTRILNEDINIFFGLNGSGKTSLLKILHAAMSMDRDILRNVPFKQANIIKKRQLLKPKVVFIKSNLKLTRETI